MSLIDFLFYKQKHDLILGKRLFLLALAIFQKTKHII
jgi:hypothetical protein